MIDQLTLPLRISLQASIFLVLVLLLTRLFGRWLTPRVRFWLWGLVLLRFLIPFAPPSSLSLYRVFTVSQPAEIARTLPVPDESNFESNLDSASFAVAPMRPFGPHYVMPELTGNVGRSSSNQNREDHRMVEVEEIAHREPLSPIQPLYDSRISNFRLADFPWAYCVFCVWLCGVVVFGLRLLWCELALLRRQRDWQLDPLHETLVAEVRDKVKLRRSVRVYLTSEPVGAASCGILRPKIVLSRQFLEAFTHDEIRLVLLHEMVHHKRFDPLTHLLSLVVRVLHWPNPLAWLLVAQLRNEREPAVDETVVRLTGIDAAPDYGNVILKTVRHCATVLPAPGLLGVQSNDQILERRIQMILQLKKTNFWRIAFGVLLVMLLALVGLTDAKPGATVQPESDQPATSDISVEACPELNENNANVVIRGRVVDEDGNPVAGVLVRYVWFAYTQQDKIAQTDNDGYFAIEMEPRHVNPWGWIYAVSEDLTMTSSQRFHLEEGSLKIPETIITLKPGRVITGKVVDQNGKPVEGATVAGADQTTRSNYVSTNVEGEFRFSFPREVESDLKIVYAFKENVGFDYHCTQDVKIDDGPFALTLAPIKPVEIKVVNEGGEPLPGAEVGAWLISKEGEKDSFNTSGAPNFFDSWTNAEGIATLLCLPEWAIHRTRYTAYGPTEGVLLNDGTRTYYGSDDKRMKEFPEGQEIPTFVLPKQARVKGTVKLPDGTPVAWTRITRARHAACGHGIRFTDANGEFELRENVNELFDLAVDESKFGATPGVFAFDVGDGSTEKRLDFVLEKGIRLYGTVYATDGKPAEIAHSVFIYENDPNPEPCDPDSEDCPDGGCPVGVVIRQTSNYGSDVFDGQYEYLLPAVPRSYRISADCYGAEGYTSHEFALLGDEAEYKLDLYLKVESDE